MSVTISEEEFRKALAAYCEEAGVTTTENMDGSILLQPINALVKLHDGKIVTESEPVREALLLTIADMREAAKASNQAIKPARQVNMPATERTSSLGHPARSTGGLTVQDILNYINPKATEAEARLFLEFCNRKGADPMKRQIYLVVYEGPNGRQVNFITSKEYFTEKAEKHPQFDGFRAGIIVRKKDGGEPERREGTFWIPGEEILLGGWAEVHRKDRSIPIRSEVPLADYSTDRNLVEEDAWYYGA